MPNVETVQLSNNWWMEKKVYEDNETVLDYKKELNINMYYNVNDP